MKSVRSSPRHMAPGLVLVLLGLTGLPGWAQFKVVGPDGRITYTDRPPHLDAQPLRLGAAEPAANAPEGTLSTTGLPFVLRQAVQRYPVQLYTAASCAPCEAARQYLRLRGVPWREWTVETPEDLARFRREFGAAELPLLRVGAQQHVGFAESDWRLTLDAAGYPATSQLPPGYAMPAARALQPLPTEPARPAQAQRDPPRGERAADTGEAAVRPQPATGGIRF